MKCQECSRPATGMLTNLSGNMKIVCDECANEIREKQVARWLHSSFNSFMLYEPRKEIEL